MELLYVWINVMLVLIHAVGLTKKKTKQQKQQKYHVLRSVMGIGRFLVLKMFLIADNIHYQGVQVLFLTSITDHTRLGISWVGSFLKTTMGCEVEPVSNHSSEVRNSSEDPSWLTELHTALLNLSFYGLICHIIQGSLPLFWTFYSEEFSNLMTSSVIPGFLLLSSENSIYLIKYLCVVSSFSECPDSHWWLHSGKGRVFCFTLTFFRKGKRRQWMCWVLFCVKNIN